MNVTINTDASFSRKLERGAYAFWIVCDEFKLTKHGLLRKKIVRPEIAELMCIINAVFLLSQQKTGKKIRKIFINTDCLNVIHTYKNDNEAIKKYKIGVLKTYNFILVKLIKQIGCEVEFRHVRSHTTTEGARNWVNDWCDKKAKESLSKLLK